MKNGLFALNWNDLLKGVITAVIAAVIAVLYGVVIVTGFDVFKADWVSIYHNTVNAGVVTLVSYLFKNLLTDNNGTVAGVIPTK